MVFECDRSLLALFGNCIDDQRDDRTDNNPSGKGGGAGMNDIGGAGGGEEIVGENVCGKN